MPNRDSWNNVKTSLLGGGAHTHYSKCKLNIKWQQCDKQANPIKLQHYGLPNLLFRGNVGTLAMRPYESLQNRGASYPLTHLITTYA